MQSIAVNKKCVIIKVKFIRQTVVSKFRKEYKMEDEKDLGTELEQEQKPEKTFTQAELDKILEERLARAKKPEDYDDLKEMLAELEDYGYPQSAKEAKEAIKQAKAQAKAEKDLEELEEQAALQGTSPELLKKMAELESKIGTLEAEKNEKQKEAEKKLQEAKEQEEADKAWKAQIDEMANDHPEVDLETLESNPKFIKFIKGKSGYTLKELYEEFTELIGETETEIIKKAMSKAERSTSSGKGASGGGGSILSEVERQSLKDWNTRNPELKMTEKEFLSYKGR